MRVAGFLLYLGLLVIRPVNDEDDNENYTLGLRHFLSCAPMQTAAREHLVCA